jgi:flagellar assembly factor FliW
MEAAAEACLEEKAFEFAQGLFGFPDIKRFVVTDVPGGGDVIKQMVALDQPDIGFTLIYPAAFFPEYAPDIPEQEMQDLGATGPDQLVVMVIANIPGDVKHATVNLKAPVIFNPYTRKARQVILADDCYTTRHRLFKAE